MIIPSTPMKADPALVDAKPDTRIVVMSINNDKTGTKINNGMVGSMTAIK